jgi:hypothetical protein
LAFVVSSKEKGEMIMKDLQAVADWISGLINDIEVIWSIFKNNTIPNLFQVTIISANDFSTSKIILTSEKSLN